MRLKNIFLTIFILPTFFFLTVPVNAKENIEIEVKKEETANVYTAYIQIKTDASLAIQGYDVLLEFNPKILNLETIEYIFGRVSSGLGDETTTAPNINKKGRVHLQGEIASADGGSLNKDTPTTIAKLNFRKIINDQILLNRFSGSGSVFKINQDGSLERLMIKIKDTDFNTKEPKNNDRNDYPTTTQNNTTKTNISLWEKIVQFLRRLWQS